MKRAVLALVTILVPMAASAARFPGERAWGRQEAKQYRRELSDDRRDFRAIERLLARFDDAVARRSRQALVAVESDVVGTLDREIREARLELIAARSDRRYFDRDIRNVRDERRDLIRLRDIRFQFGWLLGRVDRRGIERKRALVAELVTLARFELREDCGEWRERDRVREAWYRTN